MTRLLFLFSIFFTGAASYGSLLLPDQSGIMADVGAMTRYNYNVFYNFDSALSDASLLVTPSVLAHTKPRYFYAEANAKGAYEKFSSQSVQDHFDYSVSGKSSINDGGINSFYINLDQSQFSDPAFTAAYGRMIHQASTAEGIWNLRTDLGNQVKMSGQYKLENINVPGYAFNPHYLDHYSMDGVMEYDVKFLPETVWFLRGKAGYRSYTSPTLDSTLINQYVAAKGYSSIKTSNQYYMGELGINGRLTDKTSIDAATGFLAKIYPTDDSFLAPVFYLHFIEQVTRRDQLIAGYNYVVEDAYSTNYFLNQEIYIGLARVMGDQLLILAQVSYEYKNYSTPLPRNDQRVSGGMSAKYSLKPNFKITAEVKVDLLASDAYDTSVTPLNPDRPVTYKAGSLGVGFIATF